MTTQSLIRLGGIAALIGGAAFILSSVGAAFGLVPAAADGYRSLATLLINLFALTALYAAYDFPDTAWMNRPSVV